MHERTLDEQAAALSMRKTLEQDLGRTLLRAVRGAGDGPAKFVVPIGTQEVHVAMSLKPLSPQMSASDVTVLPLLEELARVAETVRSRHSRDVPHPNNGSAAPRDAKAEERSTVAPRDVLCSPRGRTPAVARVVSEGKP